MVENIILGCTSADNNIPRDDIFDYHPLSKLPNSGVP